MVMPVQAEMKIFYFFKLKMENLCSLQDYRPMNYIYILQQIDIIMLNKREFIPCYFMIILRVQFSNKIHHKRDVIL